MTPPITCAINLLSRPSSAGNALKASEDGLILVITRKILHILTPEVCVKLPDDHWKHEGFPLTRKMIKNAEASREVQGLRFCTYTIPVPEKEVRWDIYTNDGRLLPPLPTEDTWRQACWSPTGMNEIGGSILAALSSNNEVVLYSAVQSCHRGRWQPVENVTKLLIQKHGAIEKAEADETDMQNYTLDDPEIGKCILTAISWSQASQNTRSEGSFLGVVSRAGIVSIWSYHDDATNRLVLQGSESLQSGKLVNAMSWSSWVMGEDQTFTAYLACSTSEPLIQILQIAYNPMDLSVNITKAQDLKLPSGSCTNMAWCSQNDKHTFVAASLGNVFIYDTSSWKVQTLELGESQQTSAPSPFALCTAIQYNPLVDSLLLALDDGSCRTLTNLTSTPILLDQSIGAEMVDIKRARNSFSIAESMTVAARPATAARNVMKLGGMSTSTMGDLWWIYESVPASNPIYKQDVKQNCTLLHQFFLDHEQIPATASTYVNELLKTTSSPLRESTATSLRPIALAIRANPENDLLVNDLVTICKQPVSDDHMNLDNDSMSTTEALSKTLYESPKLSNLRLKVAILELILLHSTAPNSKEVTALEELKLELTKARDYEVYSNVATILESSSAKVPEHEKANVARIRAAAEHLQHQTLDASNGVTWAQTLPEICAACNAEVYMDDLESARCLHGHIWTRCSLSLVTVYGRNLKTCAGCGRTARRVATADPENDVEGMLALTRVCPFCTGRWMVK